MFFSYNNVIFIDNLNYCFKHDSYDLALFYRENNNITGTVPEIKNQTGVVVDVLEEEDVTILMYFFNVLY